MEPPPVPSPMPTKPPIHTYHCLCTNIIVATTTPLPDLARRSSNSLDRAYILQLPSPPTTHNDDGSDSEGDHERSTARATSSHYALLLATTLSKKAQIVTRTDGFEKRYLQLCGRCRLPIGYQLDWGQYGEKEGRKEDVVYLLPGGLVSTEDMARGKNMEDSIGFGEVSLGN